MRKLVILSFVSLDGVMQAPGGKGEDPSGGFHYEGWTVPFWDDSSAKVMSQQIKPPFDLLLGHNTYNIFAGYWPKHTDNPIGEAFSDATKYVVTDEPVGNDWKETIQIKGDVPQAIRELKKGDGTMLQVHGSGLLIQTLLEHDLADELWLKIFPVTLGQGKRLWGEGVRPAGWKLVDSSVTDSGVIIANYARDGDVKTGSFD